MKWNNLVNVGVIVTWHIKGFSAPSDMLYSAVYWQVLISLHRKGDLPQVVRLEGSATIVGGQLLQIHRLSDHSALQQGSGVDHLLQACVSVPLTGASSSHTRTHTHTHLSIQLYSPRTVRSHLRTVSGSLAVPRCQCTSNFSPHLPPLLIPFSFVPLQLLCIWNHHCLYSGWLSRKGEPITGIWMIVSVR